MSTEEFTLPPVVFILGGPGSGKGTQCEQIINAAENKSTPGLPNKIYHINVGGLLRQAQQEYRDQLANNCVTEGMAKAGPVLEEMLAQGQILPSWVTVTLMREEMRKIAKEIAIAQETDPTYTGGVLVDGFPRSIENLENWELIIGVARRLIVISCDEDAMVSRVLGRAASSPGGAREDDMQEATIRKRIDVFNSQTKQVISVYTLTHSASEALEKASDKRIGVQVDGDRPVQEVTVDFMNAFITLTSKI